MNVLDSILIPVVALNALAMGGIFAIALGTSTNRKRQLRQQLADASGSSSSAVDAAENDVAADDAAKDAAEKAKMHDGVTKDATTSPPPQSSQPSQSSAPEEPAPFLVTVYEDHTRSARTTRAR